MCPRFFYWRGAVYIREVDIMHIVRRYLQTKCSKFVLFLNIYAITDKGTLL